MLMLMLAGGNAHARGEADAIRGRARPYESPQRFALELRFTPYRPGVDSDPNLHGATPYASTFGKNRPLMLSVEFDWQALRIPYVGTFGPGVSAGIWSKSAKASIAQAPGGPSGDDTTLAVYPMSLLAVIRFDVFNRMWKIPLVPYGKFGVGYALWRASSPDGTARATNDAGKVIAGAGHTVGFEYMAGLAFDLNCLDPQSALQLDNNLGVNHTYIFGEFTGLNLNGIAQKNPLRLGANTWTVGLAFEF